MKKFWLVAFLAIGLIGCAHIKTTMKNIGLCWHNDACRTEQIAKAKNAGDKAGQLASLTGIPLAPKVANPVVSYLCLVVLLASAGGALAKKEVPA